jgi:hypothetical protein
MITIGLLAVIAGLTLGLIGALSRIGEVKSDLIMMTRDRDGLERIVAQQNKLLSSDANGHVRRGAHGRFVSAKG